MQDIPNILLDMKMEDFEQKLEQENLKKMRAQNAKHERWNEFWRVCKNVKSIFYTSVLPFFVKFDNKKIFIEDSMAIYEEDKVILYAFDKKSKLIVFVLGLDKNVILVYNDKVFNGKVIDINEKDDKEVPERITFTCQAEDTIFHVMI